MKDWKEEAMNYFFDRFDYVIETTALNDFIECTGSIGGDKITYRYYKDGTICER